jgi:hypothetical protein
MIDLGEVGQRARRGLNSPGPRDAIGPLASLLAVAGPVGGSAIMGNGAARRPHASGK